MHLLGLAFTVIHLTLVYGSSGNVQGSAHHTSRTRVLVLDVDGTLYEDDCRIETQIRDNCHAYALECFGLSASDAEAMHVRWGATIRGIVEGGQPRFATYASYYNQVYPHLDMSRLRKYSALPLEGPEDSGVGGISGYSHDGSVAALRALRHVTAPIVVASNSPVFHVKRVLARLGLATLNVSAFITPERRGGVIKTEAAFWDPLFELYPNDRFHCTLVDDNALNVKLARALGMGATRIQAGAPGEADTSLRDAVVRFVLGDALAGCLGAVCKEEEGGEDGQRGFVFSDATYLAAKNEADARALSQPCLEHLKSQLARQLRGKQSAAVLDLGAGRLSLLPLLIETIGNCWGGAQDAEGGRAITYVAFESNTALLPATRNRLSALGLQPRPSALAADKAGGAACLTFAGSAGGLAVTVHVVAADFMSSAAVRTLRSLLPALPEPSESGAHSGSPRTRTKTYTPGFRGLDLLVGCCVADLVEPRALCSQLLELAGDEGGLLYLPITFAGQTRLRAPGAGEDWAALSALVLDEYHAHLEASGHHLQPARLCAALRDYGCSVLCDGSSTPSHWHIPRLDGGACYLYRCMLRFVALGTTLRALEGRGGLSVPGLTSWLAAAAGGQQGGEGREGGAAEGAWEWEVSNVDLLARLPRIPQRIGLEEEGDAEEGVVVFGALPAADLRGIPPFAAAEEEDSPEGRRGGAPGAHESTGRPASPLPVPSAAPSLAPSAPPTLPSFSPPQRAAVEFAAPREVRVVREPCPALLQGQVLVQTECSLVSTGTELKIFRGDFDSSEPADTTLAALQAPLRHPLRYGYSLVGTVVQAAEAAADGSGGPQWLGRRVFSFSPHASMVAVDASALLEVPPGLAAEDAVFLPAVETALALVMDARPLVGERVCVVGQGLIGLLVGAVLGACVPGAHLTLADTNAERLKAGGAWTPDATLWDPSNGAPWGPGGGGDFDVSIEVSGHPSGLQAALDHTGRGGRLVLGSLYGEAPAALRLGLRFHRSGLTLRASQVSAVPPELAARWGKERRFQEAWALVRRLRPSRMLGGRRVALESAAVQGAYERLDRGEDLTALFVSHE